MSRKWISEVENGKATAEFGLVCRVLDCLGAHLEVVISPKPQRGLGELFALLGERPEDR